MVSESIEGPAPSRPSIPATPALQEGAVFVAYAHEDGALVRQLVEALEQRGIDVWWDAELEPGTPFQEELQERIATAVCTLIVVSKSSVRSDFLLSIELPAAAARDVIPVIIDDTELPHLLKPLQWTDLRDRVFSRSSPEFAKLFDTLKSRRRRWQRKRALKRWLVLPLAIVSMVACYFLAGHLEQRRRASQLDRNTVRILADDYLPAAAAFVRGVDDLTVSVEVYLRRPPGEDLVLENKRADIANYLAPYQEAKNRWMSQQRSVEQSLGPVKLKELNSAVEDLGDALRKLEVDPDPGELHGDVHAKYRALESHWRRQRVLLETFLPPARAELQDLSRKIIANVALADPVLLNDARMHEYLEK